ncbi:uncharacterized protein K452DRAFT_287071 [Aplosporella prunicola CBS 121167]|uniref:Uncharacterized protein n=1 Tax=Aplosporella prunicola CBS 121167 TaxID=1176127 RepID=A0A6A6BET8_9PEZI|nr:uncharacterized protein K452DRAFT_287071 [Aplosporella prunicola CBS 121167]KAF2142660.1 hypothetical protein K452DRAFT_287071 [Aplosporella prunicola CBS 121167]
MSGFHFLTTDNPAQFKNERFLKCIRSHAMLSVRQKEQRQQSEAPSRRQSAGRAQVLRQAQAPSSELVANGNPPAPKRRRKRPAVSQPDDDDDDANKKANADDAKADDTITAADADVALEKLRRRLAKPRGRARTSRGSSIFKDPQRKLGRGVDPLGSFPDFENPRVSIWELKQRFDPYLMTEVLQTRYFPAMDGCKQAWLSTAHVKSTYADILDGLVGESQRTRQIKEEVFRCVHQDFAADPGRAASDGLFITSTLLLAAELVLGDESTIKVYENGLERIVEARGGSLAALGAEGVIASAGCSVTHLAAAVREGQPPPVFRAFQYQENQDNQNNQVQPATPTPTPQRMPESPLCCRPGAQAFMSLRAHCAPETLALLADMRALTDLFLTAAPNDTIASAAAWAAHHRARQAHMSPDSPAPRTHHLLHAACQHAAVLYSFAIAARVPFSTAGRRLGRADGSADPPTHPSVAILAALQKLDLLELAAGPLIGVLLWITLVATTAARDPSYAARQLEDAPAPTATATASAAAAAAAAVASPVSTASTLSTASFPSPQLSSASPSSSDASPGSTTYAASPGAHTTSPPPTFFPGSAVSPPTFHASPSASSSTTTHTSPFLTHPSPSNSTANQSANHFQPPPQNPAHAQNRHANALPTATTTLRASAAAAAGLPAESPAERYRRALSRKGLAMVALLCCVRLISFDGPASLEAQRRFAGVQEMLRGAERAREWSAKAKARGNANANGGMGEGNASGRMGFESVVEGFGFGFEGVW